MAWEIGEGPPQDDDFIGPHQWHENLYNIFDSKMYKTLQEVLSYFLSSVIHFISIEKKHFVENKTFLYYYQCGRC